MAVAWLSALAVTQVGAAAALATPSAITAISPNNGPDTGGTSVTIAGSGFAADATVRFAGAAATDVVVHSSESITAVSPAGGVGEPVGVSVTGASGTSSPVARDQFAYDPILSGPWLGLDNNSISNAADHEWLGPVNEFSKGGIVYDRSFGSTAGQTPSQVGRDPGSSRSYFEYQLKYDHEYGMTPVVVIEYRGYDNVFKPDPQFPQSRTLAEERAGRNTIGDYVKGFVRSALAIRELVNQRYPGMQVLFEPINEPWGYTTPQYSGAQYADVIAALLPAVRAAGIPLDDIYVAATGKGCTATGECMSNGWLTSMYAAQPSLQTEIQGWYFHPYGPPSGVGEYDSTGIQSLPLVQAAMTSGQNNIIVSEVGYCADDVGDGSSECATPLQDSAEAERHLTEMLVNAIPYHEEGWLRALLVYSRNAGGWAMQALPRKQLTRQGVALRAFASLYGRDAWLLASIDPMQGAGVDLLSAFAIY